MNTVERFTNRVENYVKYRPAYPPEVIDLFRAELGMTKDSVIADIGSGTGISSRLFLRNGNTVYGIEPNAAMRDAAEKFLIEFPNFKSVDGKAEYTTLPAETVNIVVAAQAFHWFNPEKTRAEFERILQPGGFIALIWNERQLDTTPFLREYEQLLLKFGRDYERVRHENISKEILRNFFQKEFSQRTFANVQVLDLEGLKGRMLSSSYIPSESDPEYGPMTEELRRLFDKHAEQGKIEVLYDTNIFYTEV